MDAFKDKVVVLTGGSSGIGLAIIKQLLNNDVMFVAVFELDSPNARKVIEDLEKSNTTKIGFYPCDVTNTAQLEENFESVFRTYGTIDILVNNAGVSDESFPERMIDINYKAVILGSLMMIERVGKHKGGKGGTIVNVASILGLRISILPIYSSTKSAIVSFTRTMKECFHLSGVKVVAICPGLTDTGIIASAQTLDFAELNISELLEQHVVQSADHVASAVMQLIIKGNCGDLWVSENAEPPYLVVTVEQVVESNL